MDEIIANLSQLSPSSLPGWEAQQKMINFKRPKPEEAELNFPHARQSAVMALLYPKNSQVHTVLMLRNTYHGVHSGQVSLPGGKMEPEDQDLWATALREANEELGIHPNEVKKILPMTQVYIPPSNFFVTPFLAVSASRPQFTPDPTEVNRIIETPLEAFLDITLQKEKYLELGRNRMRSKVKYFDISGEVVWGATAMMLSELAEIIKKNEIALNLSR